MSMFRRCANYSVADERNLILVGFLTFSDKAHYLMHRPRYLASLKEDGVEASKSFRVSNDVVTGHVCGLVGTQEHGPNHYR